MQHVRTIAVLNQKGGVGKTTTVANLGAAVASRGRDVCLIDLDPQSHLTLHFGIEPGSSVSIYEVLASDAAIKSAAVAVAPHLWVVPSTIDLAAAEVELAATVGREQLLRDQLTEDAIPCEFAIIDCPPSLGLLTLNALAAADEVLIPLQPHFLALQGLGKLLETVALVQRRINPSLRVTAVLLCMYDFTARLTAEVEADITSFIERERETNTPWSGMTIFKTVIRRNVKLAECPSYGKSIFEYEPSSHGAQDYGALADEFLARMQPPAPPPESQAAEQAPAIPPPAPGVAEAAAHQPNDAEESAGEGDRSFAPEAAPDERP